MATTIKTLILAVLLAAGCESSDSGGTTEHVTKPSMSRGMAEVSLDGDTRTLHGWSARYTVREERGDLDTLELSLSAMAGDDYVTVTIERSKQVERGSLTLVGTYDLAYASEPLTSGAVSMQWRNEELTSTEGTPDDPSGVLTIESHEDGRVAGTLAATMDDGSDLRVEFEGEIGMRCFVLGSDGEGTEWIQASFEHEFCASYLD